LEVWGAILTPGPFIPAKATRDKSSFIQNLLFGHIGGKPFKGYLGTIPVIIHYLHMGVSLLNLGGQALIWSYLAHYLGTLGLLTPPNIG